LDNFFVAFFSAAMVILMGACYALFFALGKLWRALWLMALAYTAYILLALCVIVLADALNLHGFWQAIAWLMLIGYLLAPHGIWYLCEGTHTLTNSGSLHPIPRHNLNRRQ
jgi:hypothetical protein